MMWIAVVILTSLWLVGFMSSYTMGGFLHILLLPAVIILVFDLLQSRRRRHSIMILGKAQEKVAEGRTRGMKNSRPGENDKPIKMEQTDHVKRN